MKKVLITGVNGLLGRYLTSLLRKDFEVVGLTSQLSDNSSNLYFDFMSSFYTKSLPRDVDIICHLAQAPNHQENFENYSDIFRINTVSTQILLDYGSQIGIEKFFFASSGSIYDSGSQPSGESDKFEVYSKTFYAKSKLFSESMARSYEDRFQIAIGRIFFMFGKNQRENFLIPSLVKKIEQQLPIFLSGENGIDINPLSASECAEMIKFLLVGELNGIFNMCGNERISLRKLAEVIGGILGTEPIFEVREPAVNVLGDNSKILRSGYIYKSTSLKDEIASAIL